MSSVACLCHSSREAMHVAPLEPSSAALGALTPGSTALKGFTPLLGVRALVVSGLIRNRSATKVRIALLFAPFTPTHGPPSKAYLEVLA